MISTPTLYSSSTSFVVFLCFSLPVDDVASVVGQLADPGTRFHRDKYGGCVERSVLSGRHVVRGMRLRNERKKVERHRVTSEQTVDIDDSYPFVFPADQGWETDDEAQDPHSCHQQPCSPR